MNTSKVHCVTYRWLFHRGVLLDVRPYQLGCGAAAHLLSAGLWGLPLPMSPAMQAAGPPAAACRTAAKPAAQPPPTVLDNQDHQPGQQVAGFLHRSGRSPSTAATPAARSPGAHAQAELTSGSARRGYSLPETPPERPSSQEDDGHARQPGCAGTPDCMQRKFDFTPHVVVVVHVTLCTLHIVAATPAAKQNDWLVAQSTGGGRWVTSPTDDDPIASSAAQSSKLQFHSCSRCRQRHTAPRMRCISTALLSAAAAGMQLQHF